MSSAGTAATGSSRRRSVSFNEVIVHEFDVDEVDLDLDEVVSPEETLKIFLRSLERAPIFLEQKVDAKRRRDFGVL